MVDVFCVKMPNAKVLTPAQCRAARGGLDWTQDELAVRAGLSRSTVRDFEKGRHDLHPASEQQIVRALEEAGVVLIPAGEIGPGVCLKGLNDPVARLRALRKVEF